MTPCQFNYSPGPAALPQAVHQKITAVLTQSFAPVSVLELGHRTPEFREIAQQSEQHLRDLLDVSEDYVVLFLCGGASTQYSTVPLNFGCKTEQMDYLNTGHWSERAIAAAKRYGKVNRISTIKQNDKLELPAVSTWSYSQQAAYCHFVDNETLTGFELPVGLVANSMTNSCPLISDMTSNFLSRRFDISKFGMVYASAQKNVGIAGITIVILRKDLLGKAHAYTPSSQNYTIQTKAESCHNTPPIFAWYVCNLMLQWTLEQGGVDEMERRSLEKSLCLYECIDQSAIYTNAVRADFRSRSNVHFRIDPHKLEARFLSEAERNGFYGLRGHKVVGGIRASLYNPMPVEGAKVLCEFMREFERTA